VIKRDGYKKGDRYIVYGLFIPFSEIKIKKKYTLLWVKK